MAQTRTDVGTRTDIGLDLYKPEMPQSKKSAKQICEDKGGYWDQVKGVCILYEKPASKPEPATAPPVKLATPEIYKDEETGKLSGVTLPTGQSFTGISPKDVKGFVSDFQENTTLPAGTQPAGTAQNEANRQARLQQLIKLGEQGLLSPQELQAIQEAPIDWGQALTAGTVGNLPSVAKRVGLGATGGAAAGGVLGLGIGAIPGAILGGIAGLISAVWGGTAANIKSQQRGEINAAKDVLTAARSNMMRLRMIAERDPMRAEEAIKLYYDQLAQVNRAYRKVQLETQGNLNKFMEDGTDILSDFELFLQEGGYADLQKIRLEQAIYRGTPATDEQLIQIYQEEFSDEE